MTKITEISDKFFNRENSDATVKDFVDGLETIANRTNVTTGPKANQESLIGSTEVYRFLSDRGTGRIYEGLKSLELMSRTIRGVTQTSASLFDNAIIAYSVAEMKAADMTLAGVIVNANIGIQEIYTIAKAGESKEIAAYDAFVSKIARQIKAGGFKTEDHINEALIRVKALVKSALNSKSTV